MVPERGHFGRRAQLLALFTTTLILLLLLPSLASANALKKSKSVYCADEKCELLYGKGRTLIKYPSPDKDILGFKKDAPVLIYGKTEDNKHFYVEINKSRGLVPRQHVQEESIQNGDLPFKVDLPGEGTDSNQPPLPSSSPPQQQLDSSASSTDDHQQQSPALETAPSSAETPGLASAPPSPINNQPDPGLEESGQFASSKHSATVIEGTTFYDDDDLLKTATPSPTYSAGAVTKTATVEVNFADNELKEHQQRPVAPVEDVAAPKGEAGASKEEATVPTSDTEMKGKVLNLLKKSTSLEKGGGNNATNAPQNKSSSSSEESASAAANKVSDDDATAVNASADSVVIKISNQSAAAAAAAASETSESALKVEEEKETVVQPAETPEAETVAAAAQPSESDAPVIVPFVENAVVENDSAVEEEKEHQQAATELEQSKPEEEEKETAESSPVENAPAKDPQKVLEGEAESSLNSLLNEGPVVAPDSNSKLDAPEVPPPVVQSQNLSVETPAAESSPAADNQSLYQQSVDSAAAPAAPVEEVAPPPAGAETAASSETKVAEVAGIPAVEPVLSDELPAVPSPQQPVVPQQPEQPVVVAVPAGGETVSLPPQMGNGGGEPVVPQGSARPPYHHHHPHHSPPSSFQAEAKMIPHSTEQQQFGEQHQQHLHQPPPPVNSAWRSSAQYQTTLPPPAEEALQAAQQQQQPQVQQQQTQTHHHQQQQFASHNPHSAHQQQQQPPHHHHHQPPPPPPPLPKLSDLVHPASANQAVPAPAQPSTGDHSAAASFPASDALVDPALYAEEVVNTTSTSSNSSRRKLLAERVAFVGVIMDIIPDEVELFFENLNVSMHAIVFTSIIAIFWSFTKVLTSFVNSSRKQGELRDITCQVQRKIFYFEAEKDKVKEEAQTAKEMLQVREIELRQLGLRKSQLEQENEALKAERNRYTSEIESLRGRASEASQNSSRLNTTLDDLTRLQHEKRDLELLNEDLEEKVTRLEGEKAALEGTVDSLTEKNKKLTAKSKEMAAEAETLLGRLKEAEQSCALLQAETASLQSTKIALHEELRNLKDDLLAAEERRGELTETVQLQTAALADAQAKLTALVGELDGKNADLASMRQLLSQLNKEVVSQKGRAEAAVAAAAQRRRLSSQRSTEQLQQQQQLNGIEDSAAAADAEAEAAAALDALNGNVGGDVEAPTTTTTTTKKADEDKENEEEEEGGETTTSVSDLQDIVKLQLRLTATELERGALAAKVKSLEAALESSRAELAALQRSNASLKAATEAAERERDKAVTGLEVLSKHFKDKELEFGREIGVQLVKREQKEEDANSLEGQLRTLEEEAESLKERLKSTKKELEETERRYRGQLNALEKQSHENWIAARNAERKYEESKAEATALRQTLTLSVKSPPPASDVLSLSGFLFDDSASSVSDHAANVSGHFGHNSSMGGMAGGPGGGGSMQLPPPPPPPPLMMMNPLAMGGGGGGGHHHHIPPPMFGGPGDPLSGDPTAAAFWATGQQLSGPPSLNSLGSLPPQQQQQQQLPPLPGHQHQQQQLNRSTASSADSSMVFVQSPAAAPPQPPPPAPSSYSTAQQQSQQYSMPNQHQQHQQQQYHQHQQNWEDPGRSNTYSPALSQRSATATPHTAAGHHASSSASAYNVQVYGGGVQQQQQQHHQHYPPQQPTPSSYGGGGGGGMTDTVTASSAGNPYSISNYQQHQHQQQSNAQHGYGGQPNTNTTSTTPAPAYHQQQQHQQQQPPPATFSASSQSHQHHHHQQQQIWTAGQPQINDPNNVYTGYPSGNSAVYGSGMPPQSGDQNAAPHSSRPASVHTHMV